MGCFAISQPREIGRATAQFRSAMSRNSRLDGLPPIDKRGIERCVLTSLICRVHVVHLLAGVRVLFLRWSEFIFSGKAISFRRRRFRSFFGQDFLRLMMRRRRGKRARRVRTRRSNKLCFKTAKTSHVTFCQSSQMTSSQSVRFRAVITSLRLSEKKEKKKNSLHAARRR